MPKEQSAKDKKKKLQLEEALQNWDVSLFARGRHLFGLLPSDPRCASCLAPFEGTGGILIRNALNIRRSTLNPLLCNQCEEIVRRLEYGSEVEMSMLFADIQGSTPLTESMTPTEFKNLIDHFYNETTHVLVHSYAIIDKLVGTAYFGAVNTTSLLATQAATGEIVISESTTQKAGIDTTNLEKRTLELKGKSAPMDIWVTRVS